MAQPTTLEIAPMFEAYGAACFEAQHLEGSLRILLLLAEEYLKAHPPKRVAPSSIETEGAQRTLGNLFKAAREKEYFTEAEKKIINKAIKERNFVIHSYWDKRAALSVRPEGRRWVIENLNELRELFRSATAILNSLINKYLAERNVSVEYYAEKATEVWESDTVPPSTLLH